jgi:hypothetical protein
MDCNYLGNMCNDYSKPENQELFIRAWFARMQGTELKELSSLTSTSTRLSSTETTRVPEIAVVVR